MKEIKINIADRFYPLKVPDTKVENVKRAANLINKKIASYKSKYEVINKEVVISMCALEIATELFEKDDKNKTENKKIENRIREINDLFDE